MWYNDANEALDLMTDRVFAQAAPASNPKENKITVLSFPCSPDILNHLNAASCESLDVQIPSGYPKLGLIEIDCGCRTKLICKASIFFCYYALLLC